ncbi:MAG: hypothetical protein CMN30_17920 [Sandaracinus sp.]|nr:hypothetical protein [Sandaracinus sp.]
MRTKLTLLALLAVPTAGYAQETETPAAMEAAPAVMAEAPAARSAAPAVMAAPAADTMAAAMATTTAAPVDPAELAARRERLQQLRQARETARAAETEAQEAEVAAEAAEEAEDQAEANAEEAGVPVDAVDEIALDTTEDELEALAEEDNLEGEDFADETDPAAAMQEDANLLENIEETDFAEAHEALHGEGAHHVTWEAISGSKMFWSSIITFIILVGLFYALLFKKGKAVSAALVSRRREIEEHLAEAQRLKAEAEAKKAEYSERLAALDGQLETLRADMVRAGEKERDRIVAEAESKAASIRKDVEFTIQQRMKQLREDLAAEMATAAIAAAEEVLRSETQPADQQRLAESYLKSLATAGTSTKETQA